jgi:hypothetical protein
LKGRYDEPKNATEPDLDDINDYNRNLYRDEVSGLVQRLNGYLKPGTAPLYAPHITFNRAIGKWKEQKFHPQTGAPVDEKEYAAKWSEWMPTAEDKKLLKDIIANEPRWIAPKDGAKDPLASIAEPRKSAINISLN